VNDAISKSSSFGYLAYDGYVIPIVNMWAEDGLLVCEAELTSLEDERVQIDMNAAFTLVGIDGEPIVHVARTNKKENMSPYASGGGVLTVVQTIRVNEGHRDATPK
jgi:hypothetical protein